MSNNLNEIHHQEIDENNNNTNYTGRDQIKQNPQGNMSYVNPSRTYVPANNSKGVQKGHNVNSNSNFKLRLLAAFIAAILAGAILTLVAIYMPNDMPGMIKNLVSSLDTNTIEAIKITALVVGSLAFGYLLSSTASAIRPNLPRITIFRNTDNRTDTENNTKADFNLSTL